MTCATSLLADVDLGLDPAVVADKLGHADPNFTIKRCIGIRGNPDTAAMAVTDQW
jgi:hypothetical protein